MISKFSAKIRPAWPELGVDEENPPAATSPAITPIGGTTGTLSLLQSKSTIESSLQNSQQATAPQLPYKSADWDQAWLTVRGRKLVPFPSGVFLFGED